jgi:sec-independent protein translocase protein TatA
VFGLSELALLLIVVVLVVGARKLPDLARSAGKSLRILKAEARAMKAGEKEGTAQDAARPRIVTGEVVSRTVTPAGGTGRSDGATRI